MKGPALFSFRRPGGLRGAVAGAEIWHDMRIKAPMTHSTRRELPMSVLTLEVNGVSRTVNVPPDTPLLWVLRDELGLLGTKYSCGMSVCGSCTVHLDGAAVRSCTTPVAGVAGRSVTTIEGLLADQSHPLRRAWLEEDVPQCGYCQPGQIMQAAALLSRNPTPTDQEIDRVMAGNLCRCGTYLRIRRAIGRAAREVSDER